MENIIFVDIENARVFQIIGRIDSSNSEQISSYIQENMPKETNVVIDFEKIEYISSAGLRLLLSLQKSCEKFEIINVSYDVYEVFEMTGFSQIMKIKKSMPVMSIEGKQCIGEGYMGKVYRYDNDTIIKVFLRDDSVASIEREIALARKAFVLGIPTAIAYNVVKIKEGGYGAVFELLKSDPLNGLIANHPEDEDKYIKMYIDLLKIIMNVTVDVSTDLPKRKDIAKGWIDYLSQSDVFEKAHIEKLYKLIDSIPDSYHLIHGDYHIKNIMLQNGEPLLIDMETLSVGHPIFEFTGFYLTYIGYPSTEPGNIPRFLGIKDEVAYRLFYDTLNEVYKERTTQERKSIEEKCALLGYAWLAYKTLVYEKDNLVRLNHARSVVISLIDKYDTLEF